MISLCTYLKKSKFVENRLKVSGFSLKIYNVNAGNRRSLLSVLPPQARKSTIKIANQKRSYIEKYVNIIYAHGTQRERTNGA